MYYFRDMNHKIYLIDIESGCSLQYRGGGVLPDVPERKREVFQPWIDRSSDSRKDLFLKYYPSKKRFYLGPYKGQTADILITDDPNNIPTRKENTMCYSNSKAAVATAAPVVNITAPDTEKEQRQYLARELHGIHWSKVDKVRDEFYRTDAPKTKTELLARLKDGKFIIDDDIVKKDGETLKSWFNLGDAISWRLKPVDEAGYQKAVNAIEVAKTKAEREIQILPPADGLKSLIEFEAFLPEGVTLQ